MNKISYSILLLLLTVFLDTTLGNPISFIKNKKSRLGIHNPHPLKQLKNKVKSFAPNLKNPDSFSNENSNSEMRLIQLSHDKSIWLPESTISNLKQNGINYMDVTPFENDNQIFYTRSIQNYTYPTISLYNDKVNDLINNIDQSMIKNNLDKLTSYHNRYYKSESGREAARWLLRTLQTYADKAQDGIATVREFRHPWKQQTVIAKIAGSDPNSSKDGVIVLGAHIDSRNIHIPWLLAAPGADDNASGCSVLMEVFRIMCNKGFKPIKTIEFHFYAAEEAGLLGSQAVYKDYAHNNISVLAMLQNDVVGCPQGTSIADRYIAVISEPSDKQLNGNLVEFIKLMISTYCNVGYKDSTCGYGCSDHSSALKAGYPAVAVFEAEKQFTSPFVHSSLDTVDRINLDHVKEYVILGLAYCYELGMMSSEVDVPLNDLLTDEDNNKNLLESSSSSSSSSSSQLTTTSSPSSTLLTTSSSISTTSTTSTTSIPLSFSSLSSSFASLFASSLPLITSETSPDSKSTSASISNSASKADVSAKNPLDALKDFSSDNKQLNLPSDIPGLDENPLTLSPQINLYAAHPHYESRKRKEFNPEKLSNNHRNKVYNKVLNDKKHDRYNIGQQLQNPEFIELFKMRKELNNFIENYKDNSNLNLNSKTNSKLGSAFEKKIPISEYNFFLSEPNEENQEELYNVPDNEFEIENNIEDFNDLNLDDSELVDVEFFSEPEDNQEDENIIEIVADPEEEIFAEDEVILQEDTSDNDDDSTFEIEYLEDEQLKNYYDSSFFAELNELLENEVNELTGNNLDARSAEIDENEKTLNIEDSIMYPVLLSNPASQINPNEHVKLNVIKDFTGTSQSTGARILTSLPTPSSSINVVSPSSTSSIKKITTTTTFITEKTQLSTIISKLETQPSTYITATASLSSTIPAASNSSTLGMDVLVDTKNADDYVDIELEREFEEGIDFFLNDVKEPEFFVNLQLPMEGGSSRAAMNVNLQGGLNEFDSLTKVFSWLIYQNFTLNDFRIDNLPYELFSFISDIDAPNDTMENINSLEKRSDENKDATIEDFNNAAAEFYGYPYDFEYDCPECESRHHYNHNHGYNSNNEIHSNEKSREPYNDIWANEKDNSEISNRKNFQTGRFSGDNHKSDEDYELNKLGKGFSIGKKNNYNDIFHSSTLYKSNPFRISNSIFTNPVTTSTSTTTKTSTTTTTSTTTSVITLSKLAPTSSIGFNSNNIGKFGHNRDRSINMKRLSSDNLRKFPKEKIQKVIDSIDGFVDTAMKFRSLLAGCLEDGNSIRIPTGEGKSNYIDDLTSEDNHSNFENDGFFDVDIGIEKIIGSNGKAILDKLGSLQISSQQNSDSIYNKNHHNQNDNDDNDDNEGFFSNGINKIDLLNLEKADKLADSILEGLNKIQGFNLEAFSSPKEENLYKHNENSGFHSLY